MRDFAKDLQDAIQRHPEHHIYFEAVDFGTESGVDESLRTYEGYFVDDDSFHAVYGGKHYFDEDVLRSAIMENIGGDDPEVSYTSMERERIASEAIEMLERFGHVDRAIVVYVQ